MTRPILKIGVRAALLALTAVTVPAAAQIASKDPKAVKAGDYQVEA